MVSIPLALPYVSTRSPCFFSHKKWKKNYWCPGELFVTNSQEYRSLTSRRLLRRQSGEDGRRWDVWLTQLTHHARLLQGTRTTQEISDGWDAHRPNTFTNDVPISESANQKQRGNGNSLGGYKPIHLTKPWVGKQCSLGTDISRTHTLLEMRPELTEVLQKSVDINTMTAILPFFALELLSSTIVTCVCQLQ